MFGRADRVLVVLHNKHGVAFLSESNKTFDESLVVAGMKADCGFIEYIADPLQVAAQLRGKADTLRFAARKRGRSTVQRDVAEPHRL